MINIYLRFLGKIFTKTQFNLNCTFIDKNICIAFKTELNL